MNDRLPSSMPECPQRSCGALDEHDTLQSLPGYRVAALVGCSAFIALLPWGDPCSFAAPRRRDLAAPSFSRRYRTTFATRALLVFALSIGFVGGLLTRSHRLIVGALSPPLAFLLGAL